MRHVHPALPGVAAGLAILLLPATLCAQPPAPAESTAPRLRLGGALTLGAPAGEFRDHIDLAGGFSGHATYGTPTRAVAMRLDAGVLVYGTETFRTVRSAGGGREIAEEVTTDNLMAHVTLGPQLAATRGRLRPYANVFAGLSYFSTTSQLPRLPPRESFFVEPVVHFTAPALLFESFLTTTHFDDTALCYGGGAGVLVQLGRGRAALDLGVRYVGNGPVRFLAEGDLEDGPGGATFSTRRSRADRFEFRLGITALR